MKELTIQEKAKAYDKALEKARIWKDKSGMPKDKQSILDDIFPELKESEDEKTRKEITEFFKNYSEHGTWKAISDVTRWIAWLEKQGEKSIKWNNNTEENKPQVNHSVLMKTTHGIVEGEWKGNQWVQYRWLISIKDSDVLSWIELSDLEKQGEQKPITFNDAHIIDSALNDYCCKQYGALHKENGGVLSFARLQHLAMDIYGWCKKQSEQKPADKVEPKFKKGDWITNGDYTWKIVEVKSLDYVLQSQDGNIVDDTISHVDKQFHSFTIEDAKDGDVLVNGSNIFIFHFINNTRLMGYSHVNTDDGRFYDDIGKNECFCLIDAVVYPATKEQRNFLFTKMKESGYEWDVDKKELKKIEQNPAWSEEDEDIINKILCICDDFKRSFEISPASTKVVQNDIDKIDSWLKSLKERVQIQPKQEWSEEDEKALGDALWCCKQAASIAKDENDMGNAWYAENWLKSLRPQNTWKPSKEQLLELRCVISGCSYDIEPLVEMEEHLKKLREE